MPNKFEIISRCEARAAGLKRYFTGKPCNHGHVDERHVFNGVCYSCSKLRPQKKTGFSVEAFKRTLIDQGGRCAICGGLFDSKNKPHADHDHATGAGRGLLCRSCNMAEGFIKKTGLTSAEFGKRLQQYLDSHSLV